MTTEPFLTPAEYAARRGCSASYVRRLRRQGRLVMRGELIDATASDALLDATDDPLRGGNRTLGAEPRLRDAEPAEGWVLPLAGGPSIKEAVRRERLAKARLAELELGEESGDLTRRREVYRDVFTLARQALERMRTMGSRLRTQLAAETDPRKCEALIDAEVALICADMQRSADDLQRAQAGRHDQPMAA